MADLDRMTRGLVDSWRRHPAVAAAGLATERDGIAVVPTALPDPTLNPAIAMSTPGDPTAAIAWVESYRALHALPGDGFDLARGVHPDLEAALTTAGHHEHVTRPGMVCAVDRLPVDVPLGLEIREVRTPDDLALFQGVQVATFDFTSQVARGFMGEELLHLDGCVLLLGLVDGQPVSTALGLLADDTVGIFGVATIGEARGQGYGSALTAAAARAFPDSDLAWLQSSADGYPVYLGMGFRVVADWVVWSRAEPEPH